MIACRGRLRRKRRSGFLPCCANCERAKPRSFFPPAIGGGGLAPAFRHSGFRSASRVLQELHPPSSRRRTAARTSFPQTHRPKKECVPETASALHEVLRGSLSRRSTHGDAQSSLARPTSRGSY